MSSYIKRLTASLKPRNLIINQSNTIDDLLFSPTSSEKLMSLQNTSVINTAHTTTTLSMSADTSVLSIDQESAGDGTDNSTLKDSQRRKLNCVHILLLTFALIAVICFTLLFFHDYMLSMLSWLESQDIFLQCFVLLLLFTAVCFPVAWGYAILIITVGYLHGWLPSVGIVFVCVTFGISFAHFVMQRTCQRSLHAKLNSDHIAAAIRVVEGHHGLRVVILTRLCPVPFGLQNGMFAMTNLRLTRYVPASMLGASPMIILNSYIGSTLRSITDILAHGSANLIGCLVLLVQIVAIAILMTIVVRMAKQELRKAVSTEEEQHPIMQV